MFSFRHYTALAAILLSASFASIACAEQVDSPRYQAWANFKVGTAVTLAGTMNNGPMQMTSELTEKLLDLTPEKATIELSTTITVMGQQHTAPARKHEITAKEDKKDVTEIGEESVDAMGKTFKCKVMQVKNDAIGANGRPSEGGAKIWASTEVPGGAVKMEFNSKDRNGDPITMTYLLKSFEAAK